MNIVDPEILSKLNGFLVNAGKGFAILILIGLAYLVTILSDGEKPSEEVKKDDDSGT